MTRVRVPVLGTVGKSLSINPDATVGAQIGVDLRGPDGVVLTLAQLHALFAVEAGEANPLADTLWRLVREIPNNVRQVELLTTVGLVTRKTDGTWVTRSLAIQADGLLEIADASGDAASPTLGAADIAALSVWARAANSAGKPAPLPAAANDTLLRRVADVLDFGLMTLAMIPDELLTYAKLQNVSANARVLGRAAGAPDAIEELALSQVLDFIGAAATGDILYRDATGWQRLPAGTDGQVLTLAAGVPTWADLPP